MIRARPQSLRLPLLSVLCAAAVLVAGCGSPRKVATSASGAPPYSGGGYYKDDGPGRNIPANIANTPDAVPRIEPHNRANFRTYTVMGQRFVPVSPEKQLRQKGVASWYGRKFHGKKTANGETYDMYAMSAAHPTLPLPSYARVTHVQSGRSVIVRVNDRGPFLRGRVIDLSYAAAAKVGILGPGSDVVVVEAITHADIRKGLNMATTAPAVAAAPRPAPRATVAAAPVTAPAPAIRQVSGPAVTLASAPAAPANAAPPAPSGGPAPDGTASTPTPDAMSALALQTASAAPGGNTPALTVTGEPDAGIYLQFGAFGSHSSADQLANRLNLEIGHVEALDAHVDSRNELHRVRIGPYPTRTAAVNAAVRIQEATGMQPLLAQR